jgi:hypothetical protein
VAKVTVKPNPSRSLFLALIFISANVPLVRFVDDSL